MKAIILHAFGDPPRLEWGDRPEPQPRQGEVVVRVAASPINPSDLIFLAGNNPNPRQLPTVPGFEGAGLVVRSGGGAEADRLLDQRVAFRSPHDRDGAWAELVAADVKRCFELEPHVSYVQGAMLQVNPLTAWAMVHAALDLGHRAAVQTAAAGALGKMIAKLARAKGLTLIDVVRRQEQIDALRAMGERHVLNSESASFDADLKALCDQLGATVAFEAVAGDLTNRILSALPRKSEVWVYGGLSGKPIQLDPMVLVYHEKTVRGFWGPQSVYDAGPETVKRAVAEIQAQIATVYRSEVQMLCPLSDFQRGLAKYAGSMSAGKVAFVPGDLHLRG